MTMKSSVTDMRHNRSPAVVVLEYMHRCSQIDYSCKRGNRVSCKFRIPRMHPDATMLYDSPVIAVAEKGLASPEYTHRTHKVPLFAHVPEGIQPCREEHEPCTFTAKLSVCCHLFYWQKGKKIF